jgi:hypothetical protein
MAELYTSFEIPNEVFHYRGACKVPTPDRVQDQHRADLFTGTSKDALDRLCHLYQDLECEYHLIQAGPKLKSRPDVPGLTPSGFTKWLTTSIFAYPDQEARRLANVIARLPVNADGPLVDGKPERLPKQLSRHLFPEMHDEHARKLFSLAVRDFFRLEVTPPSPRPSSRLERAKTEMPRSSRERSSDRRSSDTKERSEKIRSERSSDRRSSDKRDKSRHRDDSSRRRSVAVFPSRHGDDDRERRSSSSYKTRGQDDRRSSDRGDRRVEPSRSTRANSDANRRSSVYGNPHAPISGSSVSPQPRSWSTSGPNMQNQGGAYPRPTSPTSPVFLTPTSSFSSQGGGGQFEINSGRGRDRRPSDAERRYSPRGSTDEVPRTTPSAVDMRRRPSMADRSANRRSFAMPSEIGPGPTWDEYLRTASSTPKSATFERANSYHS